MSISKGGILLFCNYRQARTKNPTGKYMIYRIFEKACIICQTHGVLAVEN